LLTRITGDQGAASGVDRYGVTCVYAGTAEVRTVNQRVTGSVQLGDKCIAGSFEVSLKRACEREVRRRRPARYINVSGTIDCKSESPIVSGTFQIGAIDQRAAIRQKARDESIDTTGVLPLRAIGCGQIGRAGPASYDDIIPALSLQM
jgi:hypothetical protein